MARPQPPPRTDAERLLILSCSRTKKPDAGLLPALQRYDGPSFRVLRKFFRDPLSQEAAPEVYILSAQFGLIPATRPIPDYDCRMTRQRAAELNRQTLSRLSHLLARRPYSEVFLSLGSNYRLALVGFEAHCPATLPLTVCTAPQGRKLSALRNWLYENAERGMRSAKCRG